MYKTFARTCISFRRPEVSRKSLEKGVGLNIYSPRGHVQWNVQSIGDIIGFRIYDSSFHHARGLFFFFLAIFLQIFFPPFLSLSLSSYFPFYWVFISYFCFGLAYSLRQAGLLKKRQGQSRFSELNFSRFFSAFESFWCPPSM